MRQSTLDNSKLKEPAFNFELSTMKETKKEFLVVNTSKIVL